MQSEEMKKKGLKGVKTIIFGRTLIVVFAFLVQFALIIASFIWLRDYSFYIYAGFVVLGVLVLLHLFNSRGNPDFKLVWMIPVTVVPVFGALFYLYINSQPGTRMIYQRLQYLGKFTKQYVTQKEKVKKDLEQKSPQMGHLASYLMEYGTCPVYEHTLVTYFPLGDEQFPAMLKELEKAEKFIFMEYFILEEGDMWNTVLELLKKKVREGVEVRVMYDGMCVLALLPSFYPKILEKEGIQCKMFAPIKPFFSPHYNNRDHRKILVIDGRVAFTGGTNLADEYINKKERFGHWKDTAVMLKGEAVERFTFMFLEMWGVSERGDLEYEPYRTPKDMQMPNDGYVIPYDVMPYGYERTGKQVYLDILNTAQRYVHIMTPYLILDHEMIMALTYAAKRGVEICIIMPHIPDKWYAFAVAKTYYRELIEAGVNIYEFTPGFVHAKVFVSDDDTATVGTVNLDYRSLYLHFECGIFVYDNPVVHKIEKDFQETLKKSCKVTASDIGNTGIFMRICGRVLRLIAPLM